ncbi:D-ribose pyranase [Aquabacterium sp. A7-Y]|uniref:D-ribose pyranase n=1 Tax=Aquabacterium sp. A7-Y TaxID=1349605 RepID=UPI00223CEB79|nr:D-ribose pyranase [Aquabacterium sp. A7-Y]MCW7538780.1 D-ribose pyranase [Aquabacterium sp. A7-Y]
MKRTALLHAELSSVIASMGHGDMIVIGDAGLPIPAGVHRIDLAVSPGVPGFDAVLAAVLSELQVERALLASEACSRAGGGLPAWCAALPVRPDSVPHEELKRLSAQARAVVRTGECTPYTNVVLCAGVTF